MENGRQVQGQNGETGEAPHTQPEGAVPCLSGGNRGEVHSLEMGFGDATGRTRWWTGSGGEQEGVEQTGLWCVARTTQGLWELFSRRGDTKRNQLGGRWPLALSGRSSGWDELLE